MAKLYANGIQIAEYLSPAGVKYRIYFKLFTSRKGRLTVLKRIGVRWVHVNDLDKVLTRLPLMCKPVSAALVEDVLRYLGH